MVVENKPELKTPFIEVVNTWGFGPLVDSSINGLEMEITCIHKVPRFDRYNHIQLVGGINHRNGTTFRMSQQSCISYINGGANFFVQGPDGRVAVRVITKEQPTVGLTTYIATEADETRSNNLLSLPEC